MTRFKSFYKYSNRSGNVRHDYWVECSLGCVHLSIRNAYIKTAQPETDYLCELDRHYRTPPQCMKHDAPSEGECEFMGVPCWCDGNVSEAELNWLPHWKQRGNDPEEFLSRLREEAELWLESEGSDDD